MMKNKFYQLLYWFNTHNLEIYYLTAVLVLLLFCYGCTTTRYIPITKTDTVIDIRNNYVRDSIYFYDIIEKETKNDTIYLTKTQYRYKDRIVTDTVKVTEKEYIEKPIEVVKFKPTHFWYERYLWVSFTILLLLVLYKYKTFFISIVKKIL